MSDCKENWWDIGSEKVKVLDAILWFSHKMFFGIFFSFSLKCGYYQLMLFAEINDLEKMKKKLDTMESALVVGKCLMIACL